MLIDLDGFKNVNDTFGHPAGDELLQRVAERLRGCVLEGDTVARLGGDEFAIAIPGGTVTHASAVSRRVIAALRLPISAAGQEVRVGASIGVAELTGHLSAEELISDADIAMYVAKRNGKGRYQLFEQEMRDRTQERARLEQQLALAVAAGPDRGLLPADRQPRRLPGDRRRGAGALAARGRPDHRAGGLHPDRRGVRADQRDRRRGAPAGLRRGAGLAADRAGRRVARRRGQRLRLADPVLELLRAGRGRAGGDRACPPARSRWRSPRACCWRTPTRSSASWAGCAGSASGWPWTTSVPATRRCPRCCASRWTS